jgi:hypothetical protein
MKPPTNTREKRKKDMRRALAIVVAIPVVASGAVLATFFLSSREEETGISTTCADAARVKELDIADAGQVVVAKGEVEGLRQNAEGVFLDLGSAYPDQTLSVLIRDSSVENWTTPPEQQYADRQIAFAGELETADGSLRIEARSPADLAVCP